MLNTPRGTKSPCLILSFLPESFYPLESSTRCRVPKEFSGHDKGKEPWPKGQRGLGKK